MKLRIHNERSEQIDSLRGLACFLLVAFHVVGVNSSVGLKIDSGLYRDTAGFLSYIRMPLFTFLSGIVYSYRPFSNDFEGFLKGKIRRLLIPMVVVGTLFAVVQFLVPGTNSRVEDWSTLHIKPVGHFWFIEAIFIIFMLVFLLEVLKVFESKLKIILMFFCAIFLHLSGLNYEYFSVSGALYLLPYFLTGVFLQKFNLVESFNKKVGLSLFILALLFLWLAEIGVFTVGSKRSLGALIISTFMCVGLLSINLRSRILAKIGLFSYSIYLYHVFFTAGVRLGFHYFGVYEVNVLFAVSLFAGVIGPILLDKIFDKLNFTRVLFLGKGKLISSQK